MRDRRLCACRQNWVLAGVGRLRWRVMTGAQGTVGVASLVPVGLGEGHAEPLYQFTEMNQFMFGIVRGRDLDTYR